MYVPDENRKILDEFSCNSVQSFIYDDMKHVSLLCTRAFLVVAVGVI